MSDYEKSMVVDKSVKLPNDSYYEKTNNYLEIDEWIWLNYLENDNEFHFDSESEKNFC